MNITFLRDIGLAFIPLFFVLILFLFSVSIIESIIKPIKFSRQSPLVESTQAIIKKITAEINVSRQSSTSDYVRTAIEYEYLVNGKTIRDTIMPQMFSLPNFKDLYKRLTEQFPGQTLHVKVPIRMDPKEGVILPKLNTPFETYLSGISFQGNHFKEESHIELLYLKADHSLSFIPLFERFDWSLIVKLLITSAIAAFLIMSAFNGESSLPKLSFVNGFLLFIGISILPAISPVKTPFNLLSKAFVDLSEKSKTKFDSVEILFDQNATEQSVRRAITEAQQKSNKK